MCGIYSMLTPNQLILYNRYFDTERENSVGVKIKELCITGLTQRAIALRVGVSALDVWLYMHKYGLIRYRPVRDKKRLQEVLRVRCLNMQEAEKELGCGYHVLVKSMVTYSVIPLLRDRAWLRKKRAQGWTWRQIGERCGCNPRSVFNKCGPLGDIKFLVPDPYEKRAGYYLEMQRRRVFQKKLGRWYREPFSLAYMERLRFPGLYAFFYKKELVYIGQSSNIYKRLYVHRLYKRTHCKHSLKHLFDSDLVIAVRPDKRRYERLTLEALYIMRLKPKLNHRVDF